MQGTHDDVEITVLTETVTETKVYRSADFSPEDLQKYFKKEEASTTNANV